MKSNMYIEKAKNIFDRACRYIKELFGRTTTVKYKKNQKVIYPVRITVVVLALIIFLAAIVSYFLPAGGLRSLDVSVEMGNEYKVKTIGKNLLIYNNRGVKAINSGGETEWEIHQALSEPLAEVGGKYVLLADLAGNHYAATYKDGKEQQKFQLENDIISAKVSDSGYTVFATDTDGYKGKVVVFNKRGKELYQWNSGNGYITDVDITNNGKYLAVARLMSDGESAGTEIQFIDTRRGEVVATSERADEVAVSVKFVSGNKLIAMTDKNILGYSARGKEKFRVSLIGRSPSFYNIDSNDAIAVVTLNGRGNSVLELYSDTGKLRGAYTAYGDIRALAVNGDGAIVAEQKGIVRVSPRGKAKSVTSIAHDIKAIGYFEDERALVIGSAKAETLSVK